MQANNDELVLPPSAWGNVRSIKSIPGLTDDERDRFKVRAIALGAGRR